MASQLAQTAKVFRLFILSSIIFFILYLLFTQAFGVINRFVKSRQPPKVEPPSVAFGKLPKLNLKELSLDGEPPTYTLETTTGVLPPLPGKIKVYKLIGPQTSFLSLERTKSLARRLGFQTLAKEISPSLYLWEEGGRSLKVNTVTGNFEIDADISQMTLSVGDLRSPGEIKSLARSYLDGKGLLKFGFELGSAEVILVKKSGPALTRALSLSEASLARIDFFRAVKEGETIYPVLPQDPKKGLIEIFYVGVGGNNFPKVKSNIWDYDFASGETYPLLPLNIAWQEVKNGKGHIAYLQYQSSDSLESLSSLPLSQIFIRKVYLAYFDDENIQKFLQPIYVFEGDGQDLEGKPIEITLFYPAVDPEWLE